MGYIVSRPSDANNREPSVCFVMGTSGVCRDNVWRGARWYLTAGLVLPFPNFSPSRLQRGGHQANARYAVDPPLPLPARKIGLNRLQKVKNGS